MKIVTTGGRNYFDYAYVMWALEVLQDAVNVSHLAHGACRGADEMAGRIAKGLGIKVKEYPVDNVIDGPWPGAGPARNRRMLETERPDLVVGFHGGHGTESCCRIAMDLRIPVLRLINSNDVANVGALYKAGAFERSPGHFENLVAVWDRDGGHKQLRDGNRDATLARVSAEIAELRVK